MNNFAFTSLKFLALCILIFQITNVRNAHAQQPNLDWATYYGSALTLPTKIVYDSTSSSVYICGITADTSGIATLGVHKSSIGALAAPVVPSLLAFWQYDCFLAKFDYAGNRIWATYFGGPKQDRPSNLVVDQSGNIIVAGGTNSLTGIATSGTHVPYATYDTIQSFIVKFDSTGQRLWGSYYGNADSFSHGPIVSVAVDESNNIYFTGGGGNDTSKVTPALFPSIPVVDRDSYIAKFDSNGNRIYARYLDGENLDVANFITIDKEHKLYIFGTTRSNTGIATAGTFQTSRIDSNAMFLQKFSLAGYKIWGTYINGEGFPKGMTQDELGNTYLFYTTLSATSIATPGAHDTSFSGDYDFFVLKINNAGERVWGTYFGGNWNEDVFGNIAGDGALGGSSLKIQYSRSEHSLYIAGSTTSSTDLSYACPYEGYASDRAGIIVKFDTSGQLIWSTYYDDGIYNIALSEGRTDSSHNELYFINRTTKNGLATTGSFKPNKGAAPQAGFIGKFVDYVNCADTTLVHLIRAGDSLRAPAGYTHYTWHRTGGDTIPGATTRYYVLGSLDTAGYIYATMTNICGCPFSSDSVRILPTGIKDYPRSGIISIYPNPSSTLMNISWPASLAARQIRLLSTVGSEVYNRKLVAGSTDLALDVRQFASGVYILELVTDRGSYWGKLVVE